MEKTNQTVHFSEPPHGEAAAEGALQYHAQKYQAGVRGCDHALIPPGGLINIFLIFVGIRSENPHGSGKATEMC
ncbi:hypothetical protein KUCAC02_001765 [Chaenocephalus aceratus]|uniref:Uncharacterized protein n=1 Tax=Chaenocephalus aceratus TaxID=36190 RepID=A0ACB9XTH2_CHAAC|nr:hypothetical protein KUCAC02_001765 [Chaenocephalus aceratus]